MQAQKQLQNANYELSVKESDQRGGSRGWEQGNGAESRTKSGSRVWEQGMGYGVRAEGGSKRWKPYVRERSASKRQEQNMGTGGGSKGWDGVRFDG
jgi:hypothetical protein